jgi:two-component system, OmpR family, response regulator MprA
MESAYRLLVVDDDTEIRDALARAFRLDGYQVRTASGGAAALEAVSADGPDVIVLDLMMPDVDGVEVCRRLRAADDHTPVLMLTARDAVGDRVAGLDAGADEYLVKPFALAELHARVRALLRRADYTPGADSGRLVFADLELDPESRLAHRSGRSIELTRTEYALLELLMRNAGRVLPREVISDRIWGYELGPESNSLEVFVSCIRRKTEAGGEARLLQTIRGFGYTLRAPA